MGTHSKPNPHTRRCSIHWLDEHVSQRKGVPVGGKAGDRVLWERVPGIPSRVADTRCAEDCLALADASVGRTCGCACRACGYGCSSRPSVCGGLLLVCAVGRAWARGYGDGVCKSEDAPRGAVRAGNVGEVSLGRTCAPLPDAGGAGNQACARRRVPPQRRQGGKRAAQGLWRKEEEEEEEE